MLLEPALALLHLALDLEDGAIELVARGDVVRGRVDGHMADDALRHAADGVDLGDAVDLVAEELHADGPAGPVDGVNFHGIAAHAERVSGEIQVVSLVANFHKLLHQLLAGLFHARAERDDHVLIVDGVAKAIDARNGRDDDDVPPLEQRRRRAVAQALDLVVDGGVLFDIGVRVGDIGLRLVVIVVGNEIFHGVFREKLPELRAKLSRERLVVRQHERRAVQVRNDRGHRERLARAGHAEQHLLVQPEADALRQLADGLRLIAGGAVGRVQLEIHGVSFRSVKNVHAEKGQQARPAVIFHAALLREPAHEDAVGRHAGIIQVRVAAGLVFHDGARLTQGAAAGPDGEAGHVRAAQTAEQAQRCGVVFFFRGLDGLRVAVVRDLPDRLEHEGMAVRLNARAHLVRRAAVGRAGVICAVFSAEILGAQRPERRIEGNVLRVGHNRSREALLGRHGCHFFPGHILRLQSWNYHNILACSGEKCNISGRIL